MATLAAGTGVKRERANLLGLPLRLNAVNQRRLANFKANKRAYWSLVLFAVLFVLTLFAELIATGRLRCPDTPAG